MNSHQRNLLYRTLRHGAWLFLILFVFVGIAELLVYQGSKLAHPSQEFIKEKLEFSGIEIHQQIEKLHLHSKALADQSVKDTPKVIPVLRDELHTLARENPYFYGLITFDGPMPELWSGNIPEQNPSLQPAEQLISIGAHAYIRLAHRIGENRALIVYYTLAHPTNHALLTELKHKTQLPLAFSKSEVSTPHRVKVFLEGKLSIGDIYVPENVADVLLQQFNEKKALIRAIYLFLGIIALFTFLYYKARYLPDWQIILARIVLVLVFWPILQAKTYFFEGMEIPIPVLGELFSIKSHLIYSVFLCLLSIAISREILHRRRLFGISWYPRTIFFSVGVGVLVSLLLIGSYEQLLLLSEKLDIALFDLDVYPTFTTILFFLLTGINFAAATVLSFLLIYFILGTESDQITWVSPLSTMGFLVSTWLYLRDIPQAWDVYIVQTGVLIALYILLVQLAKRYLINKYDLRRFSPIRLTSAFVIFIVLISSPFMLKHGNLQVIQVLKEQTAEIAEEVTRDKPGVNDKRYFNQLLSEASERVFSSVYDERGRILRIYNRALINDEEYNILPPAIMASFGRTPLSEFHSDQGTLIEYLQQFGKYYIRSIAKKPSLHTYLFSLFRYFFVLLLAVSISYLVYVIISTQSFKVFQSTDKLQSRITDSYLFATLIFLMILVVVTQYVVSREGKSELISNLEQELDLAVERLNLQQRNWRDVPRLTNMQSPVFLYRDMKAISEANLGVYTSTLKNSQWMNYDIYSEMVLKGKLRHYQTYTIDGKTIVVGYHNAGKNLAGQPVILALPNFISPDYVNAQLLETISYLIVIYLFFFGIFIFGASFIAQFLTQPLLNLLDGLKRISSGQFDTMLQVNSQDEIGELANTYNLMVYKLKDLQKELSDVERQAAWSEMARQVAHEIKNPLTPMKLSIQHLNRQVNDSGRNFDELKPIINNISTSLIEQIESLANIASDFSRFAKPLSDKFSKIDLNIICQSMSTLYEHDKRTVLILDLESEPLYIQGVTDEIKRILINLIKNSSEAMPKGGIIMLRSYKHRSHAYIEVVDNGIGIPEAEKVKIFTPNFSTKTSGTGLGLAICKKLVEAHKGDISFASVKGAGTTFTLQFPLAE